MKRLNRLIMAAALTGCGQTGNLAGEITIDDQTFQATDVIAWQQPSPLDRQAMVTTVTIAVAEIDRDLAERSLQNLGFFAPATLHVQLTILDDGSCQGYDVGTSGATARFWTGKSSDLICNIRVEDSRIRGSVSTTSTALATPLRHGFNLSFETQYLQWN